MIAPTKIKSVCLVTLHGPGVNTWALRARLNDGSERFMFAWAGWNLAQAQAALQNSTARQGKPANIVTDDTDWQVLPAGCVVSN